MADEVVRAVAWGSDHARPLERGEGGQVGPQGPDVLGGAEQGEVVAPVGRGLRRASSVVVPALSPALTSAWVTQFRTSRD